METKGNITKRSFSYTKTTHKSMGGPYPTLYLFGLSTFHNTKLTINPF